MDDVDEYSMMEAARWYLVQRAASCRHAAQRIAYVASAMSRDRFEQPDNRVALQKLSAIMYAESQNGAMDFTMCDIVFRHWFVSLPPRNVTLERDLMVVFGEYIHAVG